MPAAPVLIALVTIGGWGGVAAQESSEDACPRDALRQMMASAVAHDAVADVASIELEVLRLCTVRQNLIVQIAQGEARLGELRGVAAAHTAPAPVVVMAPPAEALPPPVKATAAVVVPPEAPPERVSPPPQAEGPRMAEPAPAVPVFRWTTVYGSAGEWTARVTDGVEVWHVRAGDALPAGFEVVSVRVRPPGVAVGRDGTAWQLPGPDEG